MDQDRSKTQHRSRRAPEWLDEPGAHSSLEVCLDSRGPFIDALFAFSSSSARDPS